MYRILHNLNKSKEVDSLKEDDIRTIEESVKANTPLSPNSPKQESSLIESEEDRTLSGKDQKEEDINQTASAHRPLSGKSLKDESPSNENTLMNSEDDKKLLSSTDIEEKNVIPTLNVIDADLPESGLSETCIKNDKNATQVNGDNKVSNEDSSNRAHENQYEYYDLNKEDYDTIIKLFNLFDQEGCGSISCSELGNMMRSVGKITFRGKNCIYENYYLAGLFPTDEEVEELSKFMDGDGSGKIELNELLKNMAFQVNIEIRIVDLMVLFVV